MLRFYQNTSPGDATRYYTQALSRGDYYGEEGQAIGLWRGRAAERLGLSGQVTAEAFAALAHNRHPVTGKKLTPRTENNRTVGNDVTIDPPKSVSLLWALTGDRRIRDAFEQSNRETMEEMEHDMRTRVRQGGEQSDRVTGNMLWGTFIHETARPSKEDGLPDPQLHAHNFIFNLTYDDQERRFKAAQFRELRRDAPYYQAAFEARLADRLRNLGYAIEQRGKSWEIAGVDRGLVEKFSRRTQEIEKVARAQGITDPEQKAQLGAKTRNKKTHDLGDAELRRYWESRLNSDEMRTLAQVFDRARARGPTGVPPLLTAEQAVDYSIRHLFERDSVVAERNILGEALRHGVGSVTVEGVKDALKRAPVFWADRDGRRLVSTPEILAEERRMIAFARDGRGTRKPLGRADRPFVRDWLNRGQKAAVRHILDSCDPVILVRGATGVGKTTLLQEAAQAIEETGKQVFAFAPSAKASRGVLRKEGFADADTVARLLLDEQLQEQVRGQVVLVDEAGLLGTRTTAQLFELADRLRFRVIMVGDRNQHGAVERSGALRLLEQQAGLPVAEVTEIKRQTGSYKEAVARLNEKNTDAGLAKLDELGWVREIADGERDLQLAADYVEATSQRKKNGEYKTALVIAPTHAEGERIQHAIRETLKEEGKISGDEQKLLRLENADLTEAQRGEAASYSGGQVVQFFQNVKGFKRGERVSVVASDGTGVRVHNAAGEIKTLPLNQAGRFQVYRTGELLLAAGDRVRMTANGTTRDKAHRLNNGDLFTVTGFSRGGDIVLDNGWLVAKNFGHLAGGFVVTSYAAEGETVDQVFIGQSSQSFPASSRQQFLVSVSRGREKAVLYTDDKEALREAVRRSDERLTATELVNEKPRVAARRPRLLKWVDHLRRLSNVVAREATQRVREAVRPRVPEKVQARVQERGLDYGR